MGNLFSFSPNSNNNVITYGQDYDHHNDANQVNALSGPGEGVDNLHDQEANGVLLYNYIHGRGWTKEVPAVGLPCPQCHISELHWETWDRHTNVLKCCCGQEIETLSSYESVKYQLRQYLNLHKWCLDWISYYVHWNQLVIQCNRCNDTTVLS